MKKSTKIFHKVAIFEKSKIKGSMTFDEINAVLKVKADKVVIGGRKQIKEAMSVILKAVSDKTVVSLSEDEVDKSSSFGMIKIYEY